ncbi:MAG: lysyl oxidase family protein [Oceanococcus sp.]
MTANRIVTTLLSGVVLSTAGTAVSAHNGDSHTQSKGAKANSYAQRYEETKAKDGLISLEEAWFWHQSRTFDGQVADSAACTANNCEEYSIEIESGAKRLRVGIATPERTDTFAVEIYDPSGTLRGSDSTSNQFNSEATVDDPEGGLWTVIVRPESVESASYRLRAKLEVETPEARVTTSPENRRPLYPNLRTVPPYEFTFTAPLNPLNGLYPPDSVNPPASVAGESLISCTADEAAPAEVGGGDAVHCLRLTSGPINIGEGIYDMRFKLIDDYLEGTAQLNPEDAFSRLVVGPMQQAVHYSDGSIEFVEAGTYSFHPTHAHFHDDYILSYYIAQVADLATGELQRVGTGTKSGFCPADQLWGNWRAFEQGVEKPGGDSPGGSCSSPSNGVVGLSVGWGDVYRWQRPGQYVEFDGLGNGRYVVTAQVDEKNNVIESDETDNISYAYIEVQGETIDILERGWGASPWDPAKTVFSGPHPTQREDDFSGSDGLNSTPERATDMAASQGGALGGGLFFIFAGLLARRKSRSTPARSS